MFMWMRLGVHRFDSILYFCIALRCCRPVKTNRSWQLSASFGTEIDSLGLGPVGDFPAAMMTGWYPIFEDIKKELVLVY